MDAASYSVKDENAGKEFRCPVCLKDFSRKFTLEMHLLIHKGVKPHPCPFCGKCFRQKGTLMRHKALHSTDNLFACGLCNRGFRQKNVFLHHLKHRHNVFTESLDRRKYRSELKDYQSLMDTLPSFAAADSTAIAASEKQLDQKLIQSLTSKSAISSCANARSDSKLFQFNRMLPRNFIQHSLKNKSQACVYECTSCTLQFNEYGVYKMHVVSEHGGGDSMLDQKPILSNLISPLSEGLFVEGLPLQNMGENDIPVSNSESISSPDSPHSCTEFLPTYSNDNTQSKLSSLNKHLNMPQFNKVSSIKTNPVFCNVKHSKNNLTKWSCMKRGTGKLNCKENNDKIHFKCNQCPKTFKTKELYLYHSQMHLKPTSFVCGFCRHKFVSKVMLLAHTRSKHLKKYSCLHCHRKFTYQCLHKYHVDRCNKKLLQNSVNLPVVNIKELSSLNLEGIIGIIPISDTNITDGDLELGIPLFSLNNFKKLRCVKQLYSFNISGNMKLY